MSWTVSYSSGAAKAIRKLDPTTRRQVRAAVERLAENPERGKPLQLNLKGLRSWRTGDWRVVYRFTHERLEVLVVAVGHRREVFAHVHTKLGQPE